MKTDDRQLRLMEGAIERLKTERDQLTRQFGSVEIPQTKVAGKNCQELFKAVLQLAIALQSEALLKQDKEYLCKQVSETTKRAQFAEDCLHQVTRQLTDARHVREEVYDKYVTSRDRCKSEYEKRLQEELEKIRASTSAEMEHLRTSTKDMYERENRDLREARDTALAERDRLRVSVRETNIKYKELTTQFGELQSQSEIRRSELENEVKVKALEAERSAMVCQETLSSFRDRAMELELLHKKEEILRKEYCAMQTSLEKRIVELETQLTEKNSKLNTYERLERHLDHIIVQAAQQDEFKRDFSPTIDDGAEEKVMVSYANVPSAAKRRMEHSVQLAKRVLQLERDNRALHQDIDQESSRGKQLTNKLERCEALLEQVQQPYSLLISSVRERDEQIGQLQERIDTLDQQLRQTGGEKKRLMETRNQMSEGIKRLLLERKDNAMLKQALSELTTRPPGQATRTAVGDGGGRRPSRKRLTRTHPFSQSH